MNFFLTEKAVLRLIETPSVYHAGTDELYEVDRESLAFLREAASERGAFCEENEFVRYCLEEKILSTGRCSKTRPELVQAPEPSLRYLELQITDACNLRCRHCYIDANDKCGARPSSLPPGLIEKVLAEFDRMQGLRLLITGGEPLLHPSFSDINEMLPAFSFRKVLFTNGLLIDNDILGSLNIDEIQISIDGLADAHDSLRGKGSFAKALSAVKDSLAAGYQVSVATMIHPANLADFDEMEKMFMSLGIKDWTVDVPCVQGRLRANADIHISPELAGKYLGYGFGGGLHGSAPGFACGLHLMSVTASAMAAKCTFYGDHPVGRVAEGLRECWERIKPVKLASLNCDCDFRDTCRGGCRFRAELIGDQLGKDLYKCSFFDIIRS